MEESIITVLIVIIISFGVFKLIKVVCKPIKTSTAILLIIPTTATCGIALLIYKFFRNIFEVSSHSVNNNNANISYSNPESTKKKNKKISRSFTDVSGKTSYYDEEDNLVGTSINNGFGESVFTDSTGNYVGESFDNGLGRTTYTDSDGNITSSNKNYLGEETFSDGTTTKTDSSGNRYY